ncbi:MAG: NAD(P)H-hydrate dehydratase [Oscillospiraceae bacterium]|jgi:NAD(P)H-hydrate epimerase|nr:NAD(P)H-hydrate dehydratase [Oscillospiraceae bacterium]
MHIYDAESIAAAEREYIDGDLSVSLRMMRLAAEALVRACERRLGTLYSRKIAVFAGGGKNGGDGFAAAAELINRGCDVSCVFAGSPDRISPETGYYLGEFLDISGKASPETAMPGKSRRLFSMHGEPSLPDGILSGTDIILDCIFGIGFHGELSGKYLEAARLINSSGAFVISADIPSGAEGSAALVSRECVRADLTVSFTAPKPAHFVMPAKSFCGAVETADAGLPPGFIKSKPAADTVTSDLVRTLLPPRRTDSHKGDYGKVAVIGGSMGFTGAGRLAALAALRSGCGLSYLAACGSVYPAQASACTEVVCLPFDDAGGRFSAAAADPVLELIHRCDVCVVGPGLGRSPESDEFVLKIIRGSDRPLVIDADGINVLSENIHVLRECAAPVVLTPHDPEFSRLLHAGAVKQDIFTPDGRLVKAKDFAERHGVTLVLKGSSTITAAPDGSAYVNTSGNPGMATGGSGDVLAGVIASFIGQGIGSSSALSSAAAVYLHGYAGDLAADKLGEYGMLAGDILEMLPFAIKEHVTPSGGGPGI